MIVDLTQPRPESLIPWDNLLSLAELSHGTPPGNFVEIGVYKGGSAWVLYQIAMLQNRSLYLFDTFAGTPKEGPGQMIRAGQFSDTDMGIVQEWMPRAKIFKGRFPNTLKPEISDLSFVHVDCDLYGGCSAAIDNLWPRMVPGGIMAFDDWGFESIQVPVLEAFDNQVRFTKTKIPYVVKPL
jgi:O-methyltransferase